MSRSRTLKLCSSRAILKACMYSQSPARTHLEFPHLVFADGRPRRVSASSIMSSCTRVAVWTISTTDPSRTAPWPSYPHSLAASSSRAGRMRLPPPSRRYSPISVITVTPETASRSNSRSIASRSSRRRSSTSLTAALVVVLTLVGPVVGELHVDAKILVAQKRNYLLQRVPIFAAHAHGVALNGSLNFQLRVLDELHDLARLLDRDALLKRNPLPDRRSGCGFNCSVNQTFERDLPFDELVL